MQTKIDTIKKAPIVKRDNTELDKYIKERDELLEIIKQLVARQTVIEDDVNNNIPAEQTSIKARVKALVANKKKRTMI